MIEISTGISKTDVEKFKEEAPDIDFPWATKNIYKRSPGICGLELIVNDSIIPLDCTKSAWKYKKRSSVLRITHQMVPSNQ